MNNLSYFLISLFVVMSTGCATTTSNIYPIGKDFSSDNVSQIEKGKTTKDELVKMFGKPFSKTVSVVSENEEIWMYVYISETENDQSHAMMTETESDVETTKVETSVETMEVEDYVVTTEVANENQNTLDMLLKNGVISESDVVTTEIETNDVSMEVEDYVVTTEVANENLNTLDILLKNGVISESDLKKMEVESDVVKTDVANENQQSFDDFLDNAIVSTTNVATVEVKTRENKKTLDVLMKKGVVSNFTFTEGPEPYIEDPTESELSLMKTRY